jgi:hypothetical protein
MAERAKFRLIWSPCLGTQFQEFRSFCHEFAQMSDFGNGLLEEVSGIDFVKNHFGWKFTDKNGLGEI